MTASKELTHPPPPPWPPRCCTRPSSSARSVTSSISTTLVLFLIVRTSSLTSLGFTGDELVSKGAWLFNWQMGGMMIGGILWGLLGDRFGRLKILFGSIIPLLARERRQRLRARPHDLYHLPLPRGVGLAGELGGGITLVCEVLRANSAATAR